MVKFFQGKTVYISGQDISQNFNSYYHFFIMLNSFLFLVTLDLKLHVVETTRSEFFARDCKINIAFITKH